MKNFQLSELTEAQLLEIISLNEKGVSHYSWLDVSEIVIPSADQIVVEARNLSVVNSGRTRTDSSMGRSFTRI